jgi:bifunctional non-homologous end joining protein LigD
MPPFQLLDALPPEARRQVRRRAQPDWCSPMLATLVREQFSDKDWVFEPKLDGIRCLAFFKAGKLKLFSRNQLQLDTSFPELLAPLSSQHLSQFIVDGEVVAMQRGVSSFALLQKRKQIHVPVFYYLFDVLHLEGWDLTHLEQRHRRQLLEKAFSFRDPLRFTEQRKAAGESFYRHACSKGWEGVIAKRARSPYVHERSADWLKFKCESQQEFVIVGYTDPAGSRLGIGALLLGFYERGRLLFAGKVGTGFDTTMLKDLAAKLTPIEIATLPVVDTRSKRGYHWVRPKFVAQIAFTEWTGAGKLRHPRFLGLRKDKKPADVVRELPS